MKQMSQYTKTKKIILISLFTAIALTVFVIEAQIPFTPMIPGMKLGLSNIVTLILLSCFNPKEAFIVLMLRIALGSFLAGQLVSFFYSLSGGLLCFAAMSVSSWLLKKRNIWFTSVVGGIFHNLGQIIAAVIILKTNSVFYYFPFLMISGIITGLLTGITAEIMCGRLKKIM